MNKIPFEKIKQLLKIIIMPYKFGYIVPVLFTIVGSILGSMNPFIIGLAITELANNVIDIANKVPGAQINFRYIFYVAILLAIFNIVRQTMTYSSSYIITGAIQNSFRDLRMRINQKINTLPVSFFDSRLKGTIQNTITNDVDVVSNAMQQSLLSIIYSITSVVTTFVMMLYISVPLGLLAMIMLPLAFVFSKYIIRRSQHQFLEMQNALAEMNGYIQERYTAFTVIKLFNNEDSTIEGFQKINNRLNQVGFKANFTSSLLSPIMELLVDITYVVMILLTGFAVFSGMPIGSMQAFVQYIWIVYDPMGQITQLAPAIQSAIASMERIADFCNEEEESDEQDKPAIFNPENYAGNVSFKNVNFSYVKEDPIIKDFSFEASAGQKIAIVGATGAGKTTIINLLMRFYDIDSGDILIDGESIYDMRRTSERSLFGMVLQDAWLYNASIKENIRFGRLDATDEEVVGAAKKANVHHFIQTMPGGYDMIINEEGSNISLGQKQLLTIARAILADPQILILDEATSSVDTRLEMLIQVAMKNAMHGRTSFVIAHRLSTIKDADLILVMDSGNIVEQGTHSSLLAKKGFYEKLYNSQFSED
jgi:ATP-binding cassette subfamily B multidrug efflux pump